MKEFPNTKGYGSYTNEQSFFNCKINNSLTYLSGKQRWITVVMLGMFLLLSQYQVKAQLVNKASTKQTYAVKAYLDEMYGKKIISGQCDDKYLQYIKDNTGGKEPAIMGYDFDGICPSQEGNVDAAKAIKWVNERGGIATFQWHWISPNADGDYYSSNFKLGDALNNPNGTSYKNMMRDIDLVAGEFKKMQDAGVPVLWRPLHEAEGKWFWWGMSGGEATKKLYLLIYDRFVNYHKLNNIIWVWTSYGGQEGRENWYPGDDVVDMIVYDYEKDGSWNGFQNLFGGKGKLFGLGEEGKLPDPNNFNNKPWSYFLTWAYMVNDPSLDSKGKNTKDWLYTVYNDYRVVKLSDLPEFGGLFADAGTDKTVEDKDGNGSEWVTLDASKSNDTKGTITSYTWSEGNTVIANGITASLNFALGTHTIALTVKNNLGKEKTDTVIIKITKNNIALSKPVMVSSTEAGFGNIAANAVDGNDLTRWASEYSNPQWFRIDLLAEYTITDVMLSWELASGKDYRIEVSVDGTNWTSIATKVEMPVGPRQDNIAVNSVGRYIRMYGTIRNTLYGYSLFEFKVYGELAKPIDVTGLILNPESVTMEVNTTKQLTAAIIPSNASNKNVTFASSNSTIATVNSSGLVTAVSAGTANILATTENGGFEKTSTITVTPKPLNIAINKAITVSSTEAGFGNVADNAVDGNTSTRWSSLYADPQWIYVDLGGFFDITSVVLNWENAYGSSYKIEASNNASSWLELAVLSNGNGGIDIIPVTALAYRYIRVYATVRATQWGYSLYEFEVYGTPANSDEEAPSVPQNVISTSQTETSISLSWNAATDNIGVKNYKIYNGTVLSATIAGTNYTVTGLSANSSYSFTVKAVDAAGNESDSSTPIQVSTLNKEINIALNKPVFVSSTEAGANVAALAVDGNSTTRWSSMYADPQWIYVDLGATYAITKVNLNWELACAAAYEVQTSLNANAWTSVKTVSNGSAGLVSHVVSVQARYVRIYCIMRNTQWGNSLWDFEVYGTLSDQNSAPIANAGSDLSIEDTDGDGKEPVALNGSASYDPDADGSIVLYVWSQNGETVSTQANPLLNLFIGTHVFTLTVTDNKGAVGSDQVSVSIKSNNGTVSFRGVATHFEAFGTPYGGCGVPEELLETQNYVALNVYNTPGSYLMYDRPIKGADMQYIGEFNNGYNCGRWVEVAIGPDCDGTNDGQAGQPFCRGEGAQWVDDQYNDAKLYMIVGDACGDPNAWCRDSEFHLDLSTHALNIFEKNGSPVNDMYPLHFNNRKITWNYTKAPNYMGDIKIYFMQNAQYYWPAIMINHLENGIHGVEQFVNNSWVPAERNSDMGQAFILQHASPFRIRVIDADDSYINNGREYIFEYPAQCNGKCPDPATEVNYTVANNLKSGFVNPYVNSEFKMQAYAVSGNAFLKWEGAIEGNASVIVTDLMGRTVRKSEFYSAINSESYGIGTLKQGIYIISYKNIHNQLFNVKISIP